MRKRLIASVAISALAAGMFWGCVQPGESDGSEQIYAKEERISENSRVQEEQKVQKEQDARKPIQIKEIDFQRLSNKEIQIIWSVQEPLPIEKYVIKRRQNGEDDWRILGTQVPDETAAGRKYSFVDTMDDMTPQQYEYRVDVAIKDDTAYRAVEGKSILASNILICIDPGHYEGQNAVNENGILYAEGDFTLELAKELQKILQETYGIASYLTRESGTITLDGYTNGDLDHSHISLRGEFAEGSDLFLSLHTNANLEGANGYGTYEQPISITKPIVIANTAACGSALAVAVGNAVGNCLAEANAKMGIALPGKFREAGSFQDMIPWTDAWNDGLEVSGSICYRLGEDGDYYGVLRGAANVGVPGLIIEHGFHTVPQMRQMAVQGELKTQWANADAKGIAGGIESVLQKLWE